MSQTLAAARLSRWGVAMAAAIAGSLGFAAIANATIYRPTTGIALRDAVVAANASPGFDKIIIPSQGTMSPPTNLVITDDLYITGDHAHDAVGSGTFEGPAISGGSTDIRQNDFITVVPGARLMLAGLEINFGALNQFAAIRNNGSLRVDNVTFVANQGNPINAPSPTSTTVVTNTTIADNTQIGPPINSGGRLTVINTTITDNTGGGIQATGPEFVLRNSVLANAAQECFNQPTAESNNWDNDGSCGNAQTGDPQLEFLFFYNGPTQTRPPATGSPLINAGNPATCAPVDQAFWLRPAGGACDIGAVELNAVRDTTAPSCAVTATRRGPDEQDVTLSDTGSGIGYDGVFSEDITITNGSVSNAGLPAGGALPPNPARPGDRILTAVKADQLQRTRWSFIARDWAGNQRTCE